MFEQHTERFKVTAHHITLMQKLNVPKPGCAYNLVLADVKRPYGNSDIEGDIAKLLNLGAPDEDGQFDSDVESYMWRLVHELPTVFQIMLDNLSLCVGTYERTTDRYQIHKTPWRVLEG